MFRRELSVLMLVGCLLVAACGGGDAGDGGPTTRAGGESPDEGETRATATDAAGELQTIRVGSIPIFNDADLFVAIENGYFEEEGITVELAPATNFGANLASVLNGENHFGFASSVPIITAKSQGADIKLVAGAEVVPPDLTAEDSPDGVYTDADGPSTIADLEGTSIAVNALQNINSLAIRNALADAGGDSSTISFVEMPYPDMVGAVQGGRVDAAALVEPFSSQARNAGLQTVDGAFWIDGLPETGLIDGYFTSATLVEEDPELVEGFIAAMRAGSEFAAANPDEVRQIVVPDYIDVDEEFARGVRFYQYRSSIEPQQIVDLVDLMLEFEYIDSELAPEELLHEPG